MTTLRPMKLCVRVKIYLFVKRKNQICVYMFTSDIILDLTVLKFLSVRLSVWSQYLIEMDKNSPSIFINISIPGDQA